MLSLHRLDISGCLGMIASGNNQARFWHLRSQEIECLNHQLETLVRSPLAEGENAVEGISASRKIRELRPSREQAMRAQMHVIAAIFVIQNLLVSRHEDGHRIRQ